MEKNISELSALDKELLFLITKYLEAGPCKLSARVLKQELVKQQALPKRLDWEGEEHDQTFKELEQKYPHIQPTHLLEICSRIPPILDKEIKPNVCGLMTLLGAGRQSLLRSSKDVEKLSLSSTEFSARLNQRALYPPNSCSVHNVVKVLSGRENSGPLPRSYCVSNQMYSKIQLLCCTLGHLSAVYCLLFDRSGKYVITGADDLLVKVWSAVDGRLLATLRGASSEISDIAIDVENTLLAAGSIDRLIRVWCLQTGAPVAILTTHTGMITGVNFCPGEVNGRYYLASTSSDGSVAMWTYTRKDSVTFLPKPTQFIERTRPGSGQMISAAFSSGGMFLAAGSADHYVRVYKMYGPVGPQRVLEVEAHRDRVDSIQWANFSLRFISGSKDGTALIWRYSRQEWTHTKLLMTTKLPNKTSDDAVASEEAKENKVTMVSWDCKDHKVVTACSDQTLKVWDSFTGKLLQVLSGHKDEVFVLEGHPHDPQIIMSAGHDGMIMLWNILSGNVIASFQNNIENQGHGAVFDAKWSPDGTMMAATDSHGQILMFGLGSKPARMLKLPKDLFFHTDYRPLVRDSNHNVLDEQTQVAPHLMPPPFLVDVDGNPYPPNLQRLVPGRENCTTEQLVPNIILNPEGQQEVIQGVQEARSNIDQMIQALVHVVDGDQERFQHLVSPRSRTGARRDGDVEGVRQSRGNWQRDEINWTKKHMVRPLDKASLIHSREKINYLSELEVQDYERESLKPKEAPPPATVKPTGKKLLKKRTHGYRTRAVREQQLQDQFEDPTNLDISGSDRQDDSSQESSAISDLDSISSSSSESESSEYSDWIKDEGEVLEPPKRKSTRIRRPPAKLSKKSEDLEEVPDGFRPSEWLSAVIPKKFPYYPQMGDEIMFFKEGYQLYLDAVLHRKSYQLAPIQLNPWKKLIIKEPELVKVVGIRYEVRPPHLCCLRLAIMKRNGQLTGDRFTIKYHDIPDVIDFFVLKQTYDAALDRTWDIGDRFKSMIDDHWWWGKIDGRRFVNSSGEFLKYRIIWDNGESEFMSPWDMEPIDPPAEPVEVGGSIPVSSSEIAAILYRPRPDEWPLGDRDAACERILMGLEQVMELSAAEPFIAPVDLNRYPSYATIVEYPIDLSTIKARFENRFYRRITAAQFDIRYLATNTEKFNEAHSYIVKQARIVTELCLKIVKETCTVDVSTLYRQILENYHSSDTDDHNIAGPSSTVRHKLKLAAARTARSIRATRREASRQSKPFEWKRECRELLEMLWACRDSEPFREPLDRLEHPEYYRMVDTPMDLGTVREELRGDNYETPEDFCDDLRRIFTNSKNYTTDKRSREYAMAVRLSALAEENMNRILKTWRNLNKKGGKKSQRRKTIALRDDGNVSSEYEPPNMKKLPKKKRQLSDEDGGSSSKSKTLKGRKRSKRRHSESDEDISQNDSRSAPSTSTLRGVRRAVRLRKNSESDEHASDSDGDYQPSSSVINGYSRKRKGSSRLSKIVKPNGPRFVNGEVSREFDVKVDMSLYNAIDVNQCEPSTSKTDSVPVRRAKMIYVEQKDDSSDQNEEENSYIVKPKVKITYNGRKRFLDSEEEIGDKSTELNNGIAEEKHTDIESNNEDEEENSDVSEDKKESEENEDGKQISEDECKLNNGVLQKSSQKTVKVLFPKKRKCQEKIVKQISVVDKQENNNTRRKPLGRTAKNNVKVGLNKGKYPLRQTVKKCLAESSDDSNYSSHYKTRRTSRKVQNGFSMYVDHSDESDNLSEDDENTECEAEKDSDSDNYVPPQLKGCKRRRSSDSTCDWSSSRQGIYQRLRRSDSSQNSIGRNTQSKTGKRNIRNNSESEVSMQSNNSDSDDKPTISVSSRGRVRKLTPRARALLRD